MAIYSFLSEREKLIYDICEKTAEKIDDYQMLKDMVLEARDSIHDKTYMATYESSVRSWLEIIDEEYSDWGRERIVEEVSNAGQHALLTAMKENLIEEERE